MSTNNNNNIKAFDTTGFNIFFKREIKEIKTGIEDIDSFLNEHHKLQKQKQAQYAQQQLQIQQQQQQAQLQLQQQQQQQQAHQQGQPTPQTSNIRPPPQQQHINPPQPINPGIIELYGPSGSGKTDTCLTILINSILPSSEPFNGSEIGVIYFDNDYKFDILKLEQLLEKTYNKHNNNNNINNNNNSIEYKQFLKSCLSRFYLIRCKDSFQFLVTLNGLNQFIRNINSNLKDKSTVQIQDDSGIGSDTTTNTSSNDSVSSNSNINYYPNDINLIIIDSVSSFFWIDQKGENLNVKPNLLWIETIKRILNENIMVIATKQTIFSIPTKNFNNNQYNNQYNNNINQINVNKYLNNDQHREFLGVDWSKLVKFRKVFKLK